MYGYFNASIKPPPPHFICGYGIPGLGIIGCDDTTFRNDETSSATFDLAKLRN